MIRAWFLMASLVFIGLAFVYVTQGTGISTDPAVVGVSEA